MSNMVDRDYSLDTDVVELTRKFNTFVMNNKRRSGNVWGKWEGRQVLMK